MYAKFIKRPMDFLLSLIAVIILSPVFLILIIIGAAAMRGNPFFTQMRPGKISKKTGEEKIFRLIKFRTMTCEKDKDGNFLPDEKRLTKYGKFLRSTSLDELPELFNILKGDMSIVGPRPLMARYLPFYTERERMRHNIRPGLTGYAQVNGRNALTWEDRFELDLYYVENASFLLDLKTIFKTVSIVLSKSGIELKDLDNFDGYRKEQSIYKEENAKV